MLSVRDSARKVLDLQLKEQPDEEIQAAQQELNQRYDAFKEQYGHLNDRSNVAFMRLDPEGAFLRALERPDEQDAKVWHKMPIFSQRVVRGLGQHTASTPRDSLAVTLNETGGLDFTRMGELLGQSADDVRDALSKEGAIYKNPVGGWETAEEYLTGNVRTKLQSAETAAQANPIYKANVEALKRVQPEDLPPSQISVRMGSPWIPEEDVNAFVKHLLNAYTAWRRGGRGRQDAWYRYSPTTAEWHQQDKIDGNRAKMYSEWGTDRMAADDIIEKLLQGKLIEVYDKTDDGRVRNSTATIAAQEKANAIQEEFARWLWDDPDRAQRLARHYNDTYNNMRPRIFDGAHQTFPGMSEKWAKRLHPHQKDAIWRVVADGTALLAHEVGFGKSAVMIGSAMELRRLGLARKNLIVVPKATHPQFYAQFKALYPYAKVLFPRPEDFTPENRPEMMSRIATGDWDAVIITDTQFKRLPLRPETENAFIRDEMNDLRAALQGEEQEGGSGKKGGRGETKTHKELQKALDRMQQKLLDNQARAAEITDDTIFFEDLGIDQMFVDEADMFKNLRITTKMGQIKGMPDPKGSDRAWDMYQKVRFLQKRGSGRGVVFATGTPIANIVAEGFTMMRYLQEPLLEERGLKNFDAWAKTFGATTETLEQTPTGAYKVTQRFAKFNNVPELSNLWQSTADIRVASEVPELTALRPRMVDESGKEGAHTVIVAEPSEELRRYIEELGYRASRLSGQPQKGEDNMLKITNDARKAALDMRLVADAEDNPEGKVGLLSRKVTEIYQETKGDRGTQLIFLDLGVPKRQDKPKEEGLESEDTEIETVEEAALLKNLYGDIRNKLVAAGIPAQDIAFIHDAKTNKAKDQLFARVNAGEIRVMIGSTGKMGVGVNVQERAAALHHLDVPWRPRDIEQREGRIVRQGNKLYGPKVDEVTGEILEKGPGVRIYNYVTEGSFDAFMWQAVEAKARAINSIMRRNVVARSIEDVDSLTLTASEAKALASGNPDVMRQVQLKNDVARLQMAWASHKDAQLRARTELGGLPRRIQGYQDTLVQLKEDQDLAAETKGKDFNITLGRRNLTERNDAGKVLAILLSSIPDGATQPLGMYRGFTLLASNTPDGYRLIVRSPVTNMDYSANPVPAKDVNAAGIVTRVDNLVVGITGRILDTTRNLEQSENSLRTYREQADKPFTQQGRLQQMQDELRALEKKLQGEPVEQAA
jgi:N12 class adenine-specific DNA methylase